MILINLINQYHGFYTNIHYIYIKRKKEINYKLKEIVVLKKIFRLNTFFHSLTHSPEIFVFKKCRFVCVTKNFRRIISVGNEQFFLKKKKQ